MVEFRRRYGYSANDKVVLFVGKLTSVEGADLLPKIMEEVFREDATVVFWIVGDGPFYAIARSFCREIS
jgi:glycosyltransferase involved in cell wall biosynthesis